MIRDIEAAIDRHAEQGGTIDFWWRDDDAVRDSAALARLLDIAERNDVPLTIAAIPALVERSLPIRLRDAAHIRVAAHGLRHANHAPAGEKPAEFGSHRPMADMVREVEAAKRAIDDAFGPLAIDVFVPPWNRIAPELVGLLPGLGFRGVSAFGGADDGAVAGALRIDAQIDPVDWRGGRGLARPAVIAAAAGGAFSGSRARLGLLTHHVVFDADHWAFCEALIALAARHPAIEARSVSHFMDGHPNGSGRTEPGSSSQVATTLQEEAA